MTDTKQQDREIEQHIRHAIRRFMENVGWPIIIVANVIYLACTSIDLTIENSRLKAENARLKATQQTTQVQSNYEFKADYSLGSK